MRKTIALLSAAAALAAAAQPAGAAAPPIPVQASTAPGSDVDTMTTLFDDLRVVRFERGQDVKLNITPRDRRPSVAMPACPDCRYHALDIRS
jgi:hypothetical protein